MFIPGAIAAQLRQSSKLRIRNTRTLRPWLSRVLRALDAAIPLMSITMTASCPSCVLLVGMEAHGMVIPPFHAPRVHGMATVTIAMRARTAEHLLKSMSRLKCETKTPLLDIITHELSRTFHDFVVIYSLALICLVLCVLLTGASTLLLSFGDPSFLSVICALYDVFARVVGPCTSDLARCSTEYLVLFIANHVCMY